MNRNQDSVRTAPGGARPWQPAFWRVLPPDFEDAFEAAVSRERDRQNKFGILVGLACLIVGLATDHTVGPQVFATAVVVKSIHAVVTLVAVGVLALAASSVVREIALLAASVSAVGTQVVISSTVPGDLATVYFLMAGFYALCINFFCAFRPGQALRSGLVVFAVYLGGFHLLADGTLTTDSTTARIVLLFAAAALLTVIVPLQHERYRRKVFLSESRVAEANARLNALLRTDPLTGVSNRRAFDEELGLGVARARVSSTAIGLLLIDVDHFKIYNDGLGHPAGDDCLQTVARCLAANVRPGDTVCRYGGEEFAVVIRDGATAERVAGAGERLRAAVERTGIPHPRGPGSVVTISVGAAVVTPDQGRGGEDLIRLADDALYAAKRNGRNRVMAVDGRFGGGPADRAGAVPAKATAA